MIDLDGLKQMLARKGFDDAAIGRIARELVAACPWIAEPSSHADESQAATRLGELAAFFSKRGLTVHDLFEPEVEEREWDRVYQGVVKTLGSFGVVNVVDQCDFWVVEDFYGTPEVLVEIQDETAATDSMRHALKRYLKEKAPNFCVILRSAKSAGGADETIVA